MWKFFIEEMRDRIVEWLNDVESSNRFKDSWYRRFSESSHWSDYWDTFLIDSDRLEIVKTRYSLLRCEKISALIRYLTQLCSELRCYRFRIWCLIRLSSYLTWRHYYLFASESWIALCHLLTNLLSRSSLICSYIHDRHISNRWLRWNWRTH